MGEAPKPEPTIDVLFVGQTGIGKSTLINMIRGVAHTDDGAAKVSIDACPCTTDATPYSVKLKELEYRLWDMRGLDEAVGMDDRWVTNLKKRLTETIEKIRQRMTQQQNQLQKELRGRTSSATPILVWCIDATKVGVPAHYAPFQRAYVEYCNRNAIPAIVLTRMSPNETGWMERCGEQLAELKLGPKGSSNVDVPIRRVRKHKDMFSTEYEEDAQALRNLICDLMKR